MPNQNEKAHRFTSLHVKGAPLILYNIWDAGSARLVAGCGAQALATGSASVALAHGYSDCEKIPLSAVLQNLKHIVACTELPVSLDFEGAYGASPDAVMANAAQVIAAGAIGFNFEDQVVGTEGLYSIADQSARISAVRAASHVAGINAFINARTDIFLKAKASAHNTEMVDAAIERSHAYKNAGASGFFAPGLGDERLIAKLCEASQLPVNIMMMQHLPNIERLAELGVSRISYGPTPYWAAMNTLKLNAEAIYGKTA